MALAAFLKMESTVTFMKTIEKLEFFKALECELPVAEIFRHMETNAWPFIKNYLSFTLADRNVRLASTNRRDVFTWVGLRVSFLSLKAYVKLALSKKKKTLYLGASTGLFSHNAVVYDAHFPYTEKDITSVMYMLSCGSLSSLMGREKFLLENQAVIENYLCAPIKWLLAHIIFQLIYRTKRFDRFSKNKWMPVKEVSTKSIVYAYARFVAGFNVYKALFKFLPIKDCYVVSAYTKADVVAALKHYNVHVIEIQHGIIGRYHHGYNYHVKDVSFPIPDEVLVYNQFWKADLVAGGCFAEEKIRIFERFKYRLLHTSDSLYGKYIIFTGQAAFLDLVAKFFVDSNDCLRANNIHMLYKAHPKETPDELGSFRRRIDGFSNVSVYSGKETTEQLISQALAHVSIYSACHFDAIHFLKKTFIFDVMEDNYMSSYERNFNTVIFKIKTVDAILKVLTCG